MKRLFTTLLILSLAFSLGWSQAVFFSEYLEGSSNNKALEIYNGTGADLDLSSYAVFRLNNGATTGADTTVLSGTVVAGDVYVIGNASAIQAILDESDITGTATFFNGDDYVALVYDANADGAFDLATEAIDAIGVLGEDPGSAWDVAGVTGATNEQTLIRKYGINSGNTDWASSAGTDAANSEWIVKPQDFVGSLGSHPYIGAAPTPTVDAANVISLFSNAYTDVTVDTWSAGWDMADVSDVQLDGDDTKLYENLVFAGIEFTSQTIDASGMTHFHMDVWTPDGFDNGEVFKVKLVDFGADGAWSGGDDVEHELTFGAPTMMMGGWVSLDMPLSDFTNLTTTSHMAQLIISGDPNTVYVDNVYFYTNLQPVTFSVDMSFQITLGNFIVGTDFLDVAGTLNGWGGGDVLTDDDSDGIYTGTFGVEPGVMEYKYRINGSWDTSESLPANRMYTVVEGENIIPTVWYSDQEPVSTVNVEVYIQVDMTVQLLNGNFDPSNGDLIVIRGSHENYGNWGGAIAMALDPEQTNVYTHLSSFDNVPVGSGYEYKFVILTGGDENAAIWEGSPNRTWVATGDEVDTDENGYGEILQDVAYFADVTPDDIITQDVTVTWNVDISSAYHALAAGDTLIDSQTGSDGITAWDQVNGVCINGILSQWWDWGNDVTCVGTWAMTAVDEVTYTYSYLYTAGQAKSQQYKYGINSLDNEAGFAQNREFIIDDTNPTYVMDMDCFGEQNTDASLPFPTECAPIVTDPMVTFNVDMSFQITLGNFVVGTDFLDVAGTLNEWGGGDLLTDDDSDGIYTGTFTVAEGPMEYKFRINGNWDTSENLPANRMYTVVAGENNIPVVWYSDQEPSEPTNVEVFIQVDMTVQLLNGNFDPANGDLIVIRGSHENYGNWGGAIAMALDPEQTNVYTHLSSFDNVPVGSGYEYKFVILTGGDENAAIWEGSPNRTWVATGQEEDTDENGYGEIFQPVAYFADVTPDDIITQDVTVTWNVDISSAYRALAAGDTLIDSQTGSDGITAWDQINGIAINGILSQWWDWGNDITCVGDWAMTQTDDEGFQYSFSYVYTAGQAKSQQYKYGINSLDNEAGFAQNREFVIDDTNPTYVMGMDCFGEQNTDDNLPLPQYCGPLSVTSLPGVPTSYALSQNYPNPFNPTTTIAFALPEANNVVLTIYNALGQEIRTLKTDYLNAGNYSVTWDGLDNSGASIPSGLYIYTMIAGDQNFSKKMLMLK